MPNIKKHKVLMVVANQGFRDDEYTIPKEILNSNNIDVATGALEPGLAMGSSGTKVNVDFIIDYFLTDEDKWQEFSALIFIGGSGMEPLADNEKLLELAAKFKLANKILAAICVAPLILANAGILKGRQATVFESTEYIDLLVNAGAEYVKQEVVVDGQIITACGPKASYKFGLTLVKIIKSNL